MKFQSKYGYFHKNEFTLEETVDEYFSTGYSQSGELEDMKDGINKLQKFVKMLLTHLPNETKILVLSEMGYEVKNG